MTDEPFPWEAVYRALVNRVCELADQYPVSANRLHPELAKLARIHGEICDREPNERNTP